MRSETLAEVVMSKAKNIYKIADNHARTVQVCIDRLHELGANEQLKVLTERLQKLAVRAAAADDQSQIARRHEWREFGLSLSHARDGTDPMRANRSEVRIFGLIRLPPLFWSLTDSFTVFGWRQQKHSDNHQRRNESTDDQRHDPIAW